jgi:LacI family transcriptional regulator
VPAVFMNSRVGGGSPSLAIDSYGGARVMVRHLVARGHRTIAHVAGPADNFDSHERERGYRDELAAALPGARPRVIRGDFTETSGYAAGRELGGMTPRPAAVFAANDVMAIGCLAAFDALGLAVPGDIAIAGFDDIPLAAFVRPALTTMRVPIVELGRGAVNRLAGLIAEPGPRPGANHPRAKALPGERPRTVTTTFLPGLVVRESCGTTSRPRHLKRPLVSDGGHDEQHAPPHDPRTRDKPAPAPRPGRSAPPRRPAPAPRRR